MPAELARRGLAPFAVALFGLAVSGYLTVEHYAAAPALLACPESAVVNCAKVTTSSWSQIGPLPVAVLGLGYFLVMTALTAPPAWRLPRLNTVRISGAAAGVLMALYLIWVELFRVEAICLWCTAVHAAAVALLSSVLWTSSSSR
ncbi:vitamin K epoxide reductase family protein [Jatrophihabitans cynanchi]|jgi:uncharacterized membrane protein|uniref:Vitamin K epoxide reductase family protein n=1 Tax=Jatrophihabitans cynanchi TaxID=2944128 RepID=A0ABY7JWY0_9ACTN|nr:vitamin K epoxide reductase family protein [Jatrophihabitans sp. SB3-54]WAX55591.1 vitamin K epoxide reductase family protein [Jatrophihabitans sp. SB3-54]